MGPSYVEWMEPDIIIIGGCGHTSGVNAIKALVGAILSHHSMVLSTHGGRTILKFDY